MKDFALFAALQFLNFLVLVINIRAISHEQIAAAIVTDGLACVLGWTLIKRVSQASSWPARVGYVAGGMSASWVGIWLTRTWG